MKKTLWAIGSICLILCCMAAARADSAMEVDMSKIESLYGYNASPQNQYWTYSHQYAATFEEASSQALANVQAYIGIELRGQGTKLLHLPDLFVKLVDQEKNYEMVAMPASVTLTVGSTVYTYAQMDEHSFYASVYLGTEGKKLLQALAAADDISVEIVSPELTVDFVIPAYRYEQTIKRAAQALLNIDVWQYSAEDLTAVEAAYGLSCTKKPPV